MAKRSRRVSPSDARSARPLAGDAGRPPTRPAAGATATPQTRRTRTVRRTRERGFLERYRSLLTIGAASVGVLIIGFLFLQSGARGAYECDNLMTPGPTEPPITPRPSPRPTATGTAGIASPSAAAESPSPGATAGASPAGPATSPAASAAASPGGSPASPAASPGASASPAASAAGSPGPSPTTAPDPTPRLGFATVEMGRSHVSLSEPLDYAFCPPTSGEHYNAAAQGPIRAEFYDRSQERSPGGWIHNLEHGYIVALYRCPTADDCPSEAELAELRRFVDEGPTSPVAQACPEKVLVARFDQMSTRFAVLAWGRALLMDEFNLDTAKTFAQQWMDHEAVPERGSC